MNRHSPNFRCALLALTLALATGAQASHADGNPAAAEQRLRAGVQQLLLDLASKGELADATGTPMHFDITEPSRDVDNLGVVIDSSGDDGNGLAVLAVTPGSAAARMGVRSGDRLVEVNGQSLTGLGDGDQGHSRAVAALRAAVAGVGDGGSLKLAVDRDGRRIESTGTLQRLRLPSVLLKVGDAMPVRSTVASAAASGCGRISTFDVAPRQQQLHRAQLIAIDGRAAGPNAAPTYRLSAGRHMLTVAEAIEPRYLSFNDRQRNAVRDRHKQIEVDVKDGTTYFLAAQLDPAKSGEWRDGAYWEPVLWKETSERCTP